MELPTTKHTLPQEVQGTLAESTDSKCQDHPTSDVELRNSSVAQFQGTIKDIGECLSSSTLVEQQVPAVWSLANQTKNVQFEDKQIQVQTLLPNELYTAMNYEISRQSPQFIELVNLLRRVCQKKHKTSSFGSWPQVTEHIEPHYETFICPITKQIMNDPVTTENGVTYEKKAIAVWFEKSKEVFTCPTTGKKLMTTNLCANITLKTTIDEWKERNDAARIKIARAALSVPGTENMVLEAISDLQIVCRRTTYNRAQVRNYGLLPLLVTFLECYKGSNVTCAALELLRLLAEDVDDAKEVIGRTLDLSIIIKMLSSSHKALRHESLLLLLELSRSQSLCKKIGSISGGILMLISIKYNHRPCDSFSVVKADEILKNLETCSENIKCMAECGLFVPLVDHLIRGPDKTKTEMASYLGEIVLGHDSQTYVARRASPALLKLIHRGNAVAREAAFGALAQISSYHPNSKILVEAGIMQIMARELFTPRTLMDSKTEAAAIIGNILKSGLVEPEEVKVNTHGHTMCSDYVVYNIICMLGNSNADELNVNLIRILLCLAKCPKSTASIVSVIKETEASYTLVELINNPNEQVGVGAIKLLIELAPYMGHTLCERLCKTRGQPEDLIQCPSNGITEKQAVSANFLAKLPHQNLTLNLALLGRNVVPKIMESINTVQARRSKDADYYVEGLVGILVRFTTTLYEPQMLFLAMDNNLTSVFTELLKKTSSNEVQRLSAMGLENLSSQSMNLSKAAPQIKKPKLKIMFSLSKSRKTAGCPVHGGVCSSSKTFCLIEANAVERLLRCLDHDKEDVVEAALSVICTLIDDKLQVEESIKMLSRLNAIDHVLKLVRIHNKHEGLQHKSFRMIHSFLENGGAQSLSEISKDTMLPQILNNALRHGGDVRIRQMADKILRLLNQIPNNYNTM